MQSSSKSRVRKALESIIALLPWLMAMYLFYWLDSSGTWTSETPHRGKISVGLLAGGMLMSFLVHSYFLKRRSKKAR